jgi:hypothetical protein
VQAAKEKAAKDAVFKIAPHIFNKYYPDDVNITV